MLDGYELLRLENDLRPCFTCGSADLDEFYHKDSILWGKQLISVTYAVRKNNKILAFFSLSNDSIRLEQAPSKNAFFKRVLSLVPHNKRLKSMPAVKLGRLASHTESQSTGIGSEVLDYLKMWFTSNNKTGCRFIVVDAYNNARTIKFYEKNHFKFMSESDDNENTRLMYFDLASI